MLKTRSFLICIFLCVIVSSGRSYASDYFTNAFRIFSEGRFKFASVEFERAIFYESDISKIALYKYYKSLCYKGLGDSDKSLAELNGINMFNLPDSLFFLIRYEQALGNYLISDPTQALWCIDEIRFRITDSVKTRDLIPLDILCLNTLRRWEEALGLWNYFLDHSELEDSVRMRFKTRIKSLYNKKNIPEFHSPKKAETLSRYIPGAGQIYSGAVMEGSFNFLMNASLLALAFYEFYTEYYITGYFAGLGLFNKTYHGGIRRANILATQKNEEEMKEFNREVSSLLLLLIQ